MELRALPRHPNYCCMWYSNYVRINCRKVVHIQWRHTYSYWLHTQKHFCALVITHIYRCKCFSIVYSCSPRFNSNIIIMSSRTTGDDGWLCLGCCKIFIPFFFFHRPCKFIIVTDWLPCNTSFACEYINVQYGIASLRPSRTRIIMTWHDHNNIM